MLAENLPSVFVLEFQNLWRSVTCGILKERLSDASPSPSPVTESEEMALEVSCIQPQHEQYKIWRVNCESGNCFISRFLQGIVIWMDGYWPPYEQTESHLPYIWRCSVHYLEKEHKIKFPVRRTCGLDRRINLLIFANPIECHWLAISKALHAVA